MASQTAQRGAENTRQTSRNLIRILEIFRYLTDASSIRLKYEILYPEKTFLANVKTKKSQ
jgi:hypothetical protein